MPFSAGLRLATRAALIPVIPPANYTGAASTDVYVSFKNTPHYDFLIQSGAWAGGTAAVTLLQAQDVAAAGAKALSMPVMYTNKATAGTSSVLVETAVVGDTFNLDTANALWVIPVDAAALDTLNGFGAVAVHVATPGANADYYSAVAVATQQRYIGPNPNQVNALAD